MITAAIVLAAGRGVRLRSKTSKPLIEINGTPAIAYSLAVLGSHARIRDIIVVANAKNIKQIRRMVEARRIRKVVACVLGGLKRQDSVRCGLRRISDKAEFVLIHDAARPFIDKGTVSSVIAAAEKSGAAIVGVPVRSTIKRVMGYGLGGSGRLFVKQTIDRQHLWEAQTPQVFKKSLILKAYKRFGHLNATDDSVLVEKLGQKVSVVLGSYNNIKITTPEDSVIAEAIAKKLISKRK